MNEERIIKYIENGIVIDHLPPRIVWLVARILKVDQEQTGKTSLGDNYESKKLGRKGILKIEGRQLSEYEMNLVALIAPDATISIIKAGGVESKKKATVPDILKDIVICVNPNCITNDSSEKVAPLIYHKEGEFKCHYCENSFLRGELKIKDT